MYLASSVRKCMWVPASSVAEKSDLSVDLKMNPYLIEKHASAKFCQWPLVYSGVDGCVFIILTIISSPITSYDLLDFISDPWCFACDDSWCWFWLYVWLRCCPLGPNFVCHLKCNITKDVADEFDASVATIWSSCRAPRRHKLFFLLISRSDNKTSAATIKSPCRAARC